MGGFFGGCNLRAVGYVLRGWLGGSCPFCRCGFRQVWMSVSRASCCAGAGPSRVIGDQILFCAAVDASVTLASLVLVRTVTALCNWCSPLCITSAPAS